MVGKKNIRSYEVSIWTLQDSFITVLKPLNLEHKGAIQDGKITLQDDGENRISFSIPMYIREKGEFIENPLWYNTEDGNLIANLRKLKVIFNKKTADERVFEFIITKVTENHEGFEKTCEVEGEGLAFNELGKQGYKISLSEEDLYNEVSDKLDDLKADDSTDGISVKNNINYWVDKVLAGTNWNYSIQMDWAAVDGIIDQYEEGATRYSDLSESQRETLNTNRATNGLRRHDCVYEDSYVSSWSISNNTLVPAAVVASMEKLRMVDGSESNRYNLLQSIAEAFEVYTKYKYYYDKNYHIIGREVIFYNNFLDEDNTIDLTYDYDTQSISRELDAADIVTKMYVKTLDEETYPSGLASIMDTEANKTGEDYILNFDYLYDIKTISEEQYAAIKVFEKNIANLNKQIKPLDTSIIKLEAELLDAEVARDNALALAKEAEENINFITEQLKAITNDSNYSNTVTVVKENPAFIFLSKQGNNYLGKFGSQFSGIVPGTVKVYSNPACTSAVSFTQQIKDNMVQSLTFTNSIGANTTSGYLYATFSYKPALEKEKLREDYQTLYNKNKKNYETNLTKVSQLEGLIKTKKTTRENLYNNKAKLISDFENMMGPALREGNWQPEDEYVGYGDQYDENIQLSYSSSAISTTSGKLKFIWDKELFDEEEKNYYEYGINQEKVYYPCINLTAINSNIFEKLKEEDFRNGLSFVYKNSGESNPYLLPQGVNCKFAFIQSTSGGNIIPVLMITNLYNETNITNDATASTALTYLKSLTSYITYTTDISILLNTITANNSTIFSVPSSAWITQPHKYNIVYPRLEIQSDLLKTGTNELLLHIYREKADPTDSTGERKVYTYIDKLEEFTDYSFFSRNEKKYITIKPEVLLAGKIGEAKIKINYCLANTALQIYLDAIEVMKENAYPKVSYTINQLFSPKLFYNTYDRLGQLAHINDAKLKFKNVMGYISAVELNLDKPWEDSITIQNYKNKFEDLFSTIVAQTEDMKKNAYRINAAANAFSANGLLTAEVTPESLLKSARVLNNLIKKNADVIAAKATSEAAKNKAALASTDAYRIMHGEVGLAFKGNQIDSVVLNQDKGLIIAGTTGSGSSKKSVFFRLDNAEMGFFQGTPDNLANATPQLHYENGNLALSGVMYAASGWFGGDNGWIIGSNKLSSNSATGLGGLLYSANGKAIFTSLGGGTNKTDPMIILTKTGFSLKKDDAALLFDGTNLYISGTIISTDGNIGGWYIGSDYLGNASTLANSSIGFHTNTGDNIVLWAGNKTRASAPFRVTANGALTSTSGKIANWEISNYQLNSGSGTTYVALNSGASNVTGGSAYAIWAGNATAASAPFSVTKAGKLTATGANITGVIKADTGYIGGSSGWTIQANRIYSSSFGDLNGGWPSSGNGIILHTGSNYAELDFYSNGKIAAQLVSGADIDRLFYIGDNNSNIAFWKNNGLSILGAITATSLTVGTSNTAVMTYTSTNGLQIGTGDNYLKYNSSGLAIKGDITATSGTFTGTINARSGTIGASDATQITIGNVTTNSTKYAAIYNGVTSISDTAHNGFYLGANGIVLGKGVFKVTSAGAVNASNVTITGGSLSINDNFSVSTAGAIFAKSGTIGGWSLGDSALYLNSSTPGYSTSTLVLSKGTKSTNSIGGSPANTEKTWMISASTKFGVTTSGDLYANSANITGTIIANNGRIGGTSGWYIESGYIGNASTLANSTVGMYQSTNDTDIVFWAGNKTKTSAPFRVTAGGALTATSLTIGSTSGTYLTYNSTNGLKVKGSVTATTGAIGNWKIEGDFLYSASLSHSSGWDFAGNGIVLHGASDNGEIYIYHKTGNTTSVVGRWSGTYSDNVLFKIGTDDNNYLNYSITDGLSIKGNINASSGSITGGLTVSGYFTTNADRTTYNDTSHDGITISGSGIGGYGNNGSFTMTTSGKLTATGADITGAIKATSGTIGQTNAPKIHIGSTSNASTSPSWIYSGSKSAKTSNNAGFYLGTDGLALGGTTTVNDTTVSKFQVNTDGTLYATGATIKGDITATSGTFTGTIKAKTGNIGIKSDGTGGWIIGENKIYNGTNSMSSTTAGLYLGTDGIRAYSSSAYTNITGGKITATNADLSGKITATSGQIGEWNLSSGTDTSATGHLYSKALWSQITSGNYSYEVGMKPGTASYSKAFYVTRIPKGNAWDYNADYAEEIFSVRMNGKLIAKDAEISGKIEATSGTIGGWNIRSTFIGSNVDSNYRGDQPVGMSVTGDNNYAAFWAGGVKKDNNTLDGDKTTFLVKKSGKLIANDATIRGEIKADTGYIGGWKIEGTTLSATSAVSAIKLATSSNTWSGEFSGKYFYLYKEVTNNDLSTAKLFSIALNDPDYDIFNGLAQPSAGLQLLNIPHHWSFYKDTSSYIYSPKILLNYNEMIFQYTFYNKSTQNEVNNGIDLNADSQGSLVSSHDLLISSIYDNVDIISTKSNIRISGKNIYLYGNIYINGTKVYSAS